MTLVGNATMCFIWRHKTHRVRWIGKATMMNRDIYVVVQR